MNRSKQKTMVFASLVFAAVLSSALVVSDVSDAEAGSVLIWTDAGAGGGHRQWEIR